MCPAPDELLRLVSDGSEVLCCFCGSCQQAWLGLAVAASRSGLTQQGTMGLLRPQSWPHGLDLQLFPLYPGHVPQQL